MNMYCIYAFWNKPPQRRIQLCTNSIKVLFSAVFLNIAKDNDGSLRTGCRWFQAAGPAYKNPRGPMVLVDVAGTKRSLYTGGRTDIGVYQPELHYSAL